MLTLIRRFPTASFFVAAYAISWAFWIPMLLSGAVVAPGSSTRHFPGLLGPALAAILVQAACHGTAGLWELWRRMTHVSRPVARFWTYSLTPVGFLVIAFIVLLIRGTPLP